MPFTAVLAPIRRYLFLVLPAVLSTSVTFAQQAPCVDGTAVHGGTSYQCDRIDLQAHVSLAAMNAESGNDSWGWTDLFSGREYVIMGLDNGTFFVDITTPDAPLLLGKLPTAAGSSLWRDMKVYNDHVFVVSEASGHGMQVFDLRQLRGLNEDPARTFTANVVYTGQPGHTLGRAHNVAINEDTGFAFVVGARDLSGSFVCGGGLYMVDISDPLNPSFAGCFAADGYTHDVQCVIYDGPDIPLVGQEICLASNENAVTIVNVSDKSAPVMISQTLYPNTAYTHQGWLSEDHRYFFVDDELDEATYGHNTRTIILDVTSLSTPQYVGSYYYPTLAITHNLFIRGNKLFAANYTSGLRILDIGGFLSLGSIESISEVGYFDTHPQHGNPVMQGAWSNYPYFTSGNVVVSDMNRGLFIVRPTNFGVSTDSDPTAAAASVEVYPNPFEERFTVALSIDRDQRVRGEVFDVLGRRVAELFDRQFAAGTSHELSFSLDGRPAGLYVLRVSGDHFVVSQRLTRAR